jgi:hypothetical protein
MLVIGTPDTSSSRLAHFTTATGRAARVLTWQPTAWSLAGATLLLVIAKPATLDLRLAIGGAAVAATAGFALDDPAAVTLAASPSSLRRRRAHRVAIVLVVAGTWWIGVVEYVTVRAGRFPLVDRTLLFGVLVAIALATAAAVAHLGERTGGGIAGVVVTLGAFATTFLPPRTWLPLPNSPDAPGATGRLLAVAVATVAVLWIASRDPAGRRIPGAR